MVFHVDVLKIRDKIRQKLIEIYAAVIGQFLSRGQWSTSSDRRLSSFKNYSFCASLPRASAAILSNQETTKTSGKKMNPDEEKKKVRSKKEELLAKAAENGQPFADYIAQQQKEQREIVKNGVCTNPKHTSPKPRLQLEQRSDGSKWYSCPDPDCTFKAEDKWWTNGQKKNGNTNQRSWTELNWTEFDLSCCVENLIRVEKVVKRN